MHTNHHYKALIQVAVCFCRRWSLICWRSFLSRQCGWWWLCQRSRFLFVLFSLLKPFGCSPLYKVILLQWWRCVDDVECLGKIEFIIYCCRRSSEVWSRALIVPGLCHGVHWPCQRQSDESAIDEFIPEVALYKCQYRLLQCDVFG